MSLASRPGTNSGVNASEARSRWLLTRAPKIDGPTHIRVQKIIDEISNIDENFRRPNKMR